jgi:hypothetical protein
MYKYARNASLVHNSVIEIGNARN